MTVLRNAIALAVFFAVSAPASAEIVARVDPLPHSERDFLVTIENRDDAPIVIDAVRINGRPNCELRPFNFVETVRGSVRPAEFELVSSALETFHVIDNVIWIQTGSPAWSSPVPIQPPTLLTGDAIQGEAYFGPEADCGARPVILDLESSQGSLSTTIEWDD